MATSTASARRGLLLFSLIVAVVVVFGVVYYAFASDDRVGDDDGMTAYFEDGVGMPVEIPAEVVPPGITVEDLEVAETERGLRVIGRVRNATDRTIEHVNAYVDLRQASGTDEIETVEVESLTPIAPGATGLMDAGVTTEVVAGATLQRIVVR